MPARICASSVGKFSSRRAAIFAFGLLLAILGAGCGEGAAAPVHGAKAAPAAKAASLPPPPAPVNLVWPTPNRAFLQGLPPEAFVQPTESGLVTSGLFGSTRLGGRQFHEGVDLYPVSRDNRGEALDQVYAALAGRVAYVNPRAGASSYGIYVVLEHPDESPPVYTLYAHLAAVAPEVEPGARLPAGAVIGRMGRSAGGYVIPRERAHLHFEIGVRLADAARFQAWYDGRGFGSRNEHGAYNGMNLLGLDPLEFFALGRAGRLFALAEVFAAQPTAVIVRVAWRGEPEFVTRHPALVSRLREVGLRGGWEVDFDATGVPVRWRELGLADFAGWKAGEMRVVFWDADLLAVNRGRQLVMEARGGPRPDRDLRTVLELLFD